MYLSAVLTLFLAFSASASPAIQARAPCSRDNLLRCFLVSSSAASAYCTSIVGGTTITSTTTTPTTTFISTVASVSTISSVTSTTSPTTTTTTTTTTESTAIVTVPSVTTSTVFVTITATSLTTTVVSTSTETSVVATTTVQGPFGGAVKVRGLPDTETKNQLRARVVAPPACLTQNGNAPTSYASSRVTSACSCIGVTRSTVYATATAPTSTTSTTTTVPTTATSVSTTVVTSTVTVTQVSTISSTSTTTSITSTTTTSTGAATITSTISATTTTTASATVTTCIAADLVDGTRSAGPAYTQAYRGAGFRESDTNPGRDPNSQYPLTIIPKSSYTLCTALQSCADYNNGAGSFAFYEYASDFRCQLYKNQNPGAARYFTVVDTDVRQGFGYTR